MHILYEKSAKKYIQQKKRKLHVNFFKNFLKMFSSAKNFSKEVAHILVDNITFGRERHVKDFFKIEIFFNLYFFIYTAVLVPAAG